MSKILYCAWYHPQIKETLKIMPLCSTVIACNTQQPQNDNSVDTWQFSVDGAYENRSIQTFLMCQRFLQFDYTHLLKIEHGIKWIDTELLKKLLALPPHYAGKFWRLKHNNFVKSHGIDLRRHYKFCNKNYQTKYTYHQPPKSGFAFQHMYLISRKVAASVVKQGIWYARSHIYEDMMVGCAAEMVNIHLVNLPLYSLKEKPKNEPAVDTDTSAVGSEEVGGSTDSING